MRMSEEYITVVSISHLPRVVGSLLSYSATENNLLFFGL